MRGAEGGGAKQETPVLVVKEEMAGHSAEWWTEKEEGETGDPGLEKSVQLGFQPVVGAYWGNLLGRPAGNMIVGVCVLSTECKWLKV